MPVRSKIVSLPEDIRAELESKLIHNGFADYVALEEWLAEMGYEISKSAIHRFGQKYQDQLKRIKASTEMATVLNKEIGDDEGALSDALLRLYQTKTFEMLQDMEFDETKINPVALGKAIAEIAKSSVAQKKWMSELKSKVEVKLENLSGKKGIDADTLKRIREEVYGILS